MGIFKKLKGWIIEKMVIGKEIEELRQSAIRMAEQEATEEFVRRFEEAHKEVSGNDYLAWLEKNKAEYNEVVRQSYNKWIIDLKRMWCLKNMDKVISGMDEKKSV